jgi:hypothetical protein
LYHVFIFILYYSIIKIINRNEIGWLVGATGEDWKLIGCDTAGWKLIGCDTAGWKLIGWLVGVLNNEEGWGATCVGISWGVGTAGGGWDWTTGTGAGLKQLEQHHE